MDTSQWPQFQGIINGVIIQKHVETPISDSRTDPSALAEKRAPKAPKEQPLNCPRCNSCNTKFCYYNNYSLSQPRYFCKTCKRYWTQGGSLRNVPVGGGSRKNKRPSSTSSSPSLSKKQIITLPPPRNLINEERYQNPSLASSELSLGSYVPMIPAVSADSTNNVSNMFSSTNILFPFQEFKPTLNYFAFDHHPHGLIGSGNVGVVHHQETTMAKVDGLDQFNQGQGDHDSIGLLNNGMLSGGVWQL